MENYLFQIMKKIMEELNKGKIVPQLQFLTVV